MSNQTKPIWVSVSQRANQCAVDKSTVWRHVKAGLLPEPIRITAGTSRFPAHELAAVDRAILSGADNAAIRTLVSSLRAARQQQAAA